MHSFLSRLNAVFAYSITVIGVLGFGLYLTTFIYPQTGQIQLDTSKIQVKNAHELTAGRKKNDVAFVNFDLNVDLSHLFNWNVKQLFLYLTAEYTTKANKLNQVVLWDKIILKKDKQSFDLKNLKTKYNFWDDGDGLR
jgi:signal peptidase complex subunit 3